MTYSFNFLTACLRVEKSGRSNGSLQQHLCTRSRRSSWDNSDELESRMSCTKKQLNNVILDVGLSPGKALFFLDIGADLGKEGDGDLSKICPRLVADSKCIGEGDVMRLLE